MIIKLKRVSIKISLHPSQEILVSFVDDFFTERNDVIRHFVLQYTHDKFIVLLDKHRVLTVQVEHAEFCSLDNGIDFIAWRQRS